MFCKLKIFKLEKINIFKLFLLNVYSEYIKLYLD